MSSEEVIIQIDTQGNGVNENHIHNYINKEGVWALYGKNTEGSWECLNVGKNKHVGREILEDLDCLHCIDSNDEVTERYINQFGEDCGFGYNKNQVREYLYSYIAKEYSALKFIYICEESDLEREKEYAVEHKAKFWRNGRPYKSARKMLNDGSDK